MTEADSVEGPGSSRPGRLATELVAAIERCRRSRSGHGPIVIALDGRSGAGKSTLASEAAATLDDCTVIDGDDFYAGGPEERWDAMTADEKVAWGIDWTRQRPVLEALIEGRRGEWYGYDWEAFDGRLETEPTTAEPAAVIILDGAYSARPELADLIDLRVLLETERSLRRQRLRVRDGADHRQDWEQRWSEAEEHYFEVVVPRDGFDLVLVTEQVDQPNQPNGPN